MSELSRQVIRASDVQDFFGKRERMSYKMIAEMKRHFKKKRHQPITFNEFCEYYNVTKEELRESILISKRP